MTSVTKKNHPAPSSSSSRNVDGNETSPVQPTFKVNLEDAKVARKNYFDYCESSDLPLYPWKFDVTTSVESFIEIFSPLQANEHGSETDVHSIAARVYQIRSASKKLYFLDLQYMNSTLQAMLNLAKYEDAEEFKKIMPLIKRGDMVGLTGTGMRTKAGELSILVRRIQILTPCFEMIPSNFYGLKDTETRFRHRYLDLIVNKSSRNNLVKRFQAITFIRQFLIKMGFVEVETPILHEIPGGANAKPFVTKYNAIDSEMFLRIAPELYLKQLIVGGLNRVFEIGKVFRNEDLDPTHNPEFTSCEFYMAYADYFDLMDITEEMLSKLVLEVNGSYVVKHTNDDGSISEINFERPWKRVDIVTTLEKKTGCAFDMSKFGSDESRAKLDELCVKHGVKCESPRTENRLMDKLIGHFLESDALHPTFIINHPLFMSPLAKKSRTSPHLSERFELFVNYFELCNAYTESNNLFDQYLAFKQQASYRAGGDDESMVIDHKFLSALSYGLPPTGGWGLGIDRLIMLLTDSSRIKEVIAFPTCKPELSVLSKNDISNKKCDNLISNGHQNNIKPSLLDDMSSEDPGQFDDFAQVGVTYQKLEDPCEPEPIKKTCILDDMSSEDPGQFDDFAQVGVTYQKLEDPCEPEPIKKTCILDDMSSEDPGQFDDFAQVGVTHQKLEDPCEPEPVKKTCILDDMSSEDPCQFDDFAQVGEIHNKL